MKKLAPHTLFFLIISLLYSIPALLTMFFRINDHMPYVANRLIEFPDVKWDFLVITIVYIVSFVMGSAIMNAILQRKIKAVRSPLSDTKFFNNKLSTAQRLFIYAFFIFAVFILAQLYRTGYFTMGYMESFTVDTGPRNMFVVLCDISIFIFLFLYFNSHNQYRTIKIILLSLVAVTLIVGSRMFTVPLIMFYLFINIYIKRPSKKTILRLLAFGILVFCGLIFMFTYRHDSSIGGSDIVLLLVQYEVLGVHIPLFNEIMLAWHTSVTPNFIFLFSDLLLFLVPRVILPIKNELLFFDNQMELYNLSPFGGSIGPVSVIMYFGVFFPLVFAFVGACLSYIYNLSQTKSHVWIKPLYMYICCSFMFTFMRNGILISLKNVIIMSFILFVLLVLKRVTFRLR